MRAKGIPNKKTKEIVELIDKSKLGPAEALLAILNGDYETLGHKEGFRTIFTPQGIEMEEPIIKLEHQLAAAKELMKYRYSQKKALELSGNEEKPLTVKIIDYLKNE